MSEVSVLPLDPVATRSILAEVDRGFADEVAFIEDLVRIPSLRGRELEAQELVARVLDDRGYAVDQFAIDVAEIESHPGFSPVKVGYERAVNVVGTLAAAEQQGRSLILNGHIDVVPAGPLDRWSSPPFEPVVRDGWLYGRGAGDMKAGLAANIFAVDALARLGYRPAATLYQQSVVEEECTGNGALSCLVRGYAADAAVITEPEDDRLVRANVGAIWFRLRVEGDPAHVREAGRGTNAIEATYRLLSALRELESRWNADRPRHPYFADVDQPITFNPGVIRGGDWPSSVPSWCELDARIAVYPGVDPADAAREIEGAIAQASTSDPYLATNPPTITYTGFFARGYTLEEGSEAERTLAWAHGESFGRDLETVVTPGYLDGRVFVLYGGIPCLVYGPTAERIHAFDERVSLESVRRVTGTVALFVARWCGLEADREATRGKK